MLDLLAMLELFGVGAVAWPFEQWLLAILEFLAM
jgi:hypothetical protein